MKIYSMTATFGKLEHQTLTLKPGLNIIEAPNEWGKSTWCAFLVAMLYGIDTRSKSTRSQLADKERYAPWSGTPMEGSIDLHWQGRDITIQRTTKGRIPMGEFYAFETHTGLTVPELNGENCGQMLVGVEKNVFTRTVFLRFADLPVTEDDQLRSRLNSLVTTGDESGSAQLLEQKLKELKNRCRYNKTGLIPQARQEKEALEQQLQECQSLELQTQRVQERIAALEERNRQLVNHQSAIRYAATKDHSAALAEAKATRDDALNQMEALRDQVEVIPSRESAVKKLQQLQEIRQGLLDVMMEEQMLPPTPEAPTPPQGFGGCTGEEAVEKAEQHRRELQALQPKTNFITPITIVLGAVLLFIGILQFIEENMLLCLLCSGCALFSLIISLAAMRYFKQRWDKFEARLAALFCLYLSRNPDDWVVTAQRYATEWAAYRDRDSGDQLHQELKLRKADLMAQSSVATNSKGLDSALEYWNDILQLWDAYTAACCNYRQAEKNLQALASFAQDAPAPQEPDTLTYTEEETRRLLSDTAHELRQLHAKLGQYQAYAGSLGSYEVLQQKNRALEQRLLALEQTYAALDFAQRSLKEASGQLQRRFAPRISESARELLAQMTGGRYSRLNLSQDFSVDVSAENEDILRSRNWRSDGTVDQLYLALRLAVARELIPDAPLILDDAMVRFDDTRLTAALNILQQEAVHKQVILFTCQSREQELLSKN